jgi:predicted metal-dependent hydrolase
LQPHKSVNLRNQAFSPIRNLETSRSKIIEFEGEKNPQRIICEVRKSPRSRRINLKLKRADFALLTFPKRMSWRMAEKFLHDHEDWLLRKSLEFPKPISLGQYFKDGGRICLSHQMSEREVMVVESDETDRPWIRLENDRISIHVNAGNPKEAMIKDGCRKLASQFLPDWVQWAEERTGLKAGKVRIGDQVTRWGSCSHRGTVSLNWRIILLPRDLGSYVIFHELAHLAEMNHSTRFWAKLEEFVPHAREVDRCLTRTGKKIFSLGRDR